MSTDCRAHDWAYARAGVPVFVTVAKGKAGAYIFPYRGAVGGSGALVEVE
jgi:hypothetical protein